MVNQPRPFRFGVQINHAQSAAEWQAKARLAEELGYDVLLMADHFGPLFSYGPAISMAAAVTTTLKFGTLVLQAPLRHPTLVATETATLDVLTGGRFELGVGAGGSVMSDFTQSGIPFDPPVVRVAQFEESVQVTKALLSQETVSFEGQHYNLDAMPSVLEQWKRAQPTLLIGAGGPRMLRFAAREADVISMLPRLQPQGGTFNMAEMSMDAYLSKVQLVRAAAGARFGHIEFNTLVQRLVITDDPDEEAERISQQWGVPEDAIRNSPYILLGANEDIIEQIQQRRALAGLTYYVVFEPYMHDFAPIVRALSGR